MALDIDAVIPSRRGIVLAAIQYKRAAIRDAAREVRRLIEAGNVLATPEPATVPPVVHPELTPKHDELIEAARRVAERGDKLTVKTLAREARVGNCKASMLIDDLDRRGLWPWDRNLPGGQYRPVGLTPARRRVIAVAERIEARGGVVSAGAIARELGLKTTGVAAMIRGLDGEGLWRWERINRGNTRQKEASWRSCSSDVPAK